MEQVKYSTYMKKIQMVDLQGQYERIRSLYGRETRNPLC